jgi:hypothetical protein
MLHFHKFRPIVSTLVVAAFLASNAQAVSLANIEGPVSINYGKGYQPASIGSLVVPGDRVRTSDGSVDIVYDNGCSTHVGAKQVALVLSTPPSCNGAVGYGGGGGLKDGPVPGPVEGPDVSPLAIAGLIIAFDTGVAIAVANGNNNNENPHHPFPVSP